ncbi:HAD-IIIC family phosphatase [Rubrimonas cliftonensis]|uniref:HAD-superfamily phosphatase, subfamily IIIC/FkbH-like domain-containing protein n=1 Tax=Rubrimonas cliftonensis TaxID=89524 RepID=A0A1H4CVX0_9RHOB|nr:HAD-IIIC family phosphatase [Rubrimonas cliftonensis]SEA64474.1 HAD-superfamily phosphatase, subfamily IIIC/FkbH-like domain-containing protein [Rubrimonas cliftonensis]
MISYDVAALPWLPKAPDDHREQVRAFGPGVAAAALRDAATARLDINGLTRLAKALDRVGEAVEGDALSPVDAALLADCTTDYLAPALVATAPRHGVRLRLTVGDYGQMEQALLDPGSAVARARPEVALISLDAASLGLDAPLMDAAAAAEAVARAVARLEALAAAARERLGAVPILQTVAPPAEPWSGSLDARFAGAPAAMIQALNARMGGIAEAHGGLLLDVAGLAARVGVARWRDHGQRHAAKLPFALDLTPLWADHVCRLIGAMRGKARKCLVLDLDNTLWGGVVGDDGVEGIALGQGSARGEAHLAVQRYALSLRARGIVLAVCSKNEDDAARAPFRRHPDMLLREEHVAVFVANWTDKATNLQAIARTLNIGVDALAFLDDNPAERARVRQMLPEVATPELPDDPAWYPAALAHAGYFETVALSAEDAGRADAYQANAARAVALESLGSIDAYHRSLEMRCDIRPFDRVGRARIAQLINKTNQFNVTTIRRTEAEVAEIEVDPEMFHRQIRLVDRFGDNGMIAVVIFRKGVAEWVCDTWLMSCRVLSRRVEEAALRAVAEAARAEGATRLVGRYRPTAKNRMVADLFGVLGFAKVAETEAGETEWALALADYVAPELPMEVVGPGDDAERAA